MFVSVTQYHRESIPQPFNHPRIESTTFVSPVCFLITGNPEIFLSIEATDYPSNFAKTILFENCSCFSKIPFSFSVESPRIFQCLISIPAGHCEFGKSTAIYLADSLCQLYSAL